MQRNKISGRLATGLAVAVVMGSGSAHAFPDIFGSTPTLPTYVSTTVDVNAKTDCVDMGVLLGQAQAAAVASRAPVQSVSQVINDNYGVNNLLGTKIDFGSGLTGGFGSFFSGLMDNMTQSFIGSAVTQGQNYFRGAVDGILARAGAPASTIGVVTVLSGKTSVVAGQVLTNLPGNVGAVISNIGTASALAAQPTVGPSAASCSVVKGVNMCDTLR